MDYCNIDSEIIDSLDYLRPPVKRNINSSRERIFGTNFNDQLNDVRCQLQNNSTNHETKKGYNYNSVESSTSLILKKTSEIAIFKKYSFVSHSDHANQKFIAKNKPLIKVTVIPKRIESQTKLLRKRNPIKRVHSAVSNHENSIKTQNVYLVVAGRRREKVYEIKTTGSAQLSNDHVSCCFKEVKKPLEQLSNYKELIDSLNMDKKRKKNKKKKQKRDDQIDDNIQDGGDVCHECQCAEATTDNFRTNVRSHRSRVTISGRVGVTEDDRYFLNCSATVNNKPVPVKSPTGLNLLPYDVDNNQDKRTIPADNKSFGCVNECITDIYDGCNVINEFQRDSKVQADFPDDNTCYKLMDKNTVRNNESQGTQVNFKINLSNIDSRQFQNNDCRIDTCDCDCDANLPDNRNKINNLKDCRSPLVIISVYPKKDIDTAKNITANNPSGGNARNSLLQRTRERTAYNYDSNNVMKKNDSKNRNGNRLLRISRSPSPATRNVSKTKLEGYKQLDVRVPKANVRKVSPDRRLTNDNQNIQKNSTSQKFYPKKTAFKANETKGKTLNLQGTKTHSNNTKSQDNKGTNTEHLLTKKILVENYTNNIALQMNRNAKTFPKNGVSNVKINIDGENDDYDVLLYQNNCMTDLNVRKIVKKERGSQRCCRDRSDHTTDSIQNLLQTPRQGSRKWPLLQDLYNDQSKDDWLITSHMSRLNLRDSLEIGHRRDDKITKTIKDTQTSENNKVKNINSNNMIFLAPIKHHAGDKCSVPNPLVRDKEIRELLGIEKCRATTSKAQDTQAHLRNNEQVQLQSFCHEECNRGPFDDKTNKVESKCDCRKKRPRLNKYGERPKDMMKSTGTQYEPTAIERTSLFQQMILNRNIQVFLQVEQFTKQKPIILSRKQYNKVKQSIQHTISKTQERRRSRCICKTSIISVGEVRKKAKPNLQSPINKTTQTNVQDVDICCPTKEEPLKCIEVTTSKQFKAPLLQLVPTDSHNEQDVLSTSSQEQNKDNCIKILSARNATSSVELCYASVAYLKHETFSSTKIESLTPPINAPRNSYSIQTIFKGRRKSPTPNLGTSGFSLFSEMGDSNSVKILMPPRESKPKKPFLRRLMSCLVMRSTMASEVKMGVLPSPQKQSVDSTIDSYHISTSLGAIELSSSIYDTSASFYSNHSIVPTSNKIKRGFLNSVRGYLTNRKS